MERYKSGQEPIGVEPKVLEGLNLIRHAGIYNMFDTASVIELAIEMGHVHTAAWIINNRTKYAEGLLRGFQVRVFDFLSAELSDFEDCRCGCGGRRRCQPDEVSDDE